MKLVNRAGPGHVALETTLIVHGVPRTSSGPLAAALAAIVRDRGAQPALIGVLGGTAVVGMKDDELAAMLAAPGVAKVNTSNLGITLHAGGYGATTVSATMELAAAAGVRVFATGGLGGLHRGLDTPDISADLAAFTRFPVAVVASGVKSLLNVEGTRELLETLGVPVIGFRTDHFPAFYLRESAAGVDARFDDAHRLGEFVAFELHRTGRGVLIVNPIAPEHELPRAEWDAWLAAARAGAGGRDATPATLARLHELSAGRTLAANIELVKANAALAADLCRAMPSS